FEASPHIKLQCNGRLRILRKYFDGTLALDDSELTLVIVIAGPQSSRLELVVSGVQRVGNFFPSVNSRLGLGARHHYVLAAQDQIHVARFLEVLRSEVRTAVVGGV